MYPHPDIKSQYVAETRGMNAASFGPQEPAAPRSSPLDAAINRADACSQEVASLLVALEDRLDRVLMPPIPSKETTGTPPDSGVPLIRALDELNARQDAAAARIRGLLGRLAV